MPSFSPLLKAPTGLTKILPAQCDAKNCEGYLQIGVFFDGTGNNEKADRGPNKHSNVVRLSDVYPLEPKLGNFRIYIPGVGTPFPEIGENSAATGGGGFATGGMARINYAEVQIMNSIAQYLLSKILVDDAKFRAGTSYRENPNSPYKPSSKFKEWQGQIKTLVQDTDKPKIKEILLDVFGFSRGAAEARAFVNQLIKVEGGSTLYGIPIKFRFLGIFDTVASVGPQIGGVGGMATGHMAWADGDSLKIPSQVKNCVHFIAMHENRGSFPIDVLFGQKGGVWIEHVYPGMHSDVGGGYAPNAQGVGVIDSKKLSQIPLLHMYHAAKSAGVPLFKASDDFAINPTLLNDYTSFIQTVGLSAKPLSTWLSTYLKWRCENAKTFQTLPHYQRASGNDKSNLKLGNHYLLMILIAAPTGPKGLAHSRPFEPEVLKIVSNPTLVTKKSVAAFLGNYVHDSMAGFIGDFMFEPTGYFKRRFYFSDGSNSSKKDTMSPDIPGTERGVVQQPVSNPATQRPASKPYSDNHNDATTTDYSRNRVPANNAPVNDPTYGQTIDRSVPNIGDSRVDGGGFGGS